ncbi:hypothetical protein [Ornithinimicrobium murale]|uniref:hypothetical protein n=1 Tax=Ornithinimicrobium murale TaxID=1050153 RepID=UPI000E0DA9AE|nr:hypothetical protein [Ornithinimicrobium murale]
MQLPTDPRLYLGLRVGVLVLLAACVVFSLESGNPDLAALCLILGLLLWATVRFTQSRSFAPAPSWAARSLFWVDLVVTLTVLGYLVQHDPWGVVAAFALAGVLVGCTGVALVRDLIARAARPRHVVRFVLLVAVVGGTVAYILRATSVGWDLAWATQLLSLAAACAFIGAGLGLLLPRPPHHLPDTATTRS